MKHHQLSSGDLIADRRADYAEMLYGAGDITPAVDLLRDALTLVPHWAAGWYRLGEMEEAAGNRNAASAAWREALRLDPMDRAGAALKLELIGEALPGSSLAVGFVETLFDQYADAFDTALVERLQYRVPEAITALLDEAGTAALAHVLDLGCGTGLMGERLRARSSYLEGLDISEGMLAKARLKGIYDRPERADIATFTAPDTRPDLVVAADVFAYLGRIDEIVARISKIIAPDGLLCFSVELCERESDIELRASRRYAHSRSYLLRILALNGFEILAERRMTLRLDRGEPIAGLVVLARAGIGTQHVETADLSTQATLPLSR